MPKVRTTMNPLVELDVTDKEAYDLEREGILLKSTATTRDALIADATEQSAARPSPTAVDVELDEDDEPVAIGGNVSPESFTDDEDEDEDEVGDDAERSSVWREQREDENEYDPTGDGNSTLADTETKE